MSAWRKISAPLKLVMAMVTAPPARAMARASTVSRVAPEWEMPTATSPGPRAEAQICWRWLSG